ncbi:MAG: hypothetical protein ACLP8A_03365 [Methylovirgula sp.]
MMHFSEIIIWLAIGYALLGVILLTVLKLARLPWPIKAGLIVATSAFYIVNYIGTRALLGWSSVDPLPPRFKLLSARVVEPHSLEGDPGAIHLWVEALDANNFPSGVPRAYRLPYNEALAEKAEAAVKATEEGKPQGGRTADFGTGEGGAGDATPRPVTPNSIINTAGGDPSSGGPLDPAGIQGEHENVVFTPLVPPRLPPKDRE